MNGAVPAPAMALFVTLPAQLWDDWERPQGLPCVMCV